LNTGLQSSPVSYRERHRLALGRQLLAELGRCGLDLISGSLVQLLEYCAELVLQRRRDGCAELCGVAVCKASGGK
jgi:hypothetical protein